jgi:hypothetical protein
MTTSGIEGIYAETHNWGKTVSFWQALGFVLEFETDHHSGQLRHPAGGPFVFVAERPADKELETYPIVDVPDSAAFVPAAPVVVEQPFVAEHWSRMEMFVRDPDDRRVSLQAPLPDGIDAPAGHG